MRLSDSWVVKTKPMAVVRTAAVVAAMCIIAANGRPSQHGAVEGHEQLNCHENLLPSGEMNKKNYETVHATVAHLEAVPNATKFLLFFGQPRTGHSLVGSILDAHPQMAVANEVLIERVSLQFFHVFFRPLYTSFDELRQCS